MLKTGKPLQTDRPEKPLMSKQIQDAYIVAAARTPVGKARGAFRNTRPDDLLAHVLRGVMDRCPGWTRSGLAT